MFFLIYDDPLYMFYYLKNSAVFINTNLCKNNVGYFIILGANFHFISKQISGMLVADCR